MYYSYVVELNSSHYSEHSDGDDVEVVVVHEMVKLVERGSKNI